MLVLGGIGAVTRALEIALFLPTVLAVCTLHDLGHALMARWLRHPVQSVILHPFRGLTMVHRAKPWHDFWIALSGPATNLLIAALIGGIYFISARESVRFSADLSASLQNGIIGRFVSFNLFLGLLNIVPAFPMDGGHALRALLATRLTRAGAARTAMQVSLAAAFLFVAVSLARTELYWVLFALVITVGTSKEMSSETFFAAIKDIKAREAMQANPHLLPLAQTLNGVVGSELPAAQRFFPVVCGDEVFGVLSRSRIEEGIRGGKGDTYVAQWMNRQTIFVDPDEPLKAALERNRISPGSPLLVGEQGNLLGMITLESVQQCLTRTPQKGTPPPDVRKPTSRSI